ncbi:hypothetical protein ABB37_04745 [Leptomonas pyrrhocoris]|uniref:Integral membrane protein n=1 Tax=Leptomonas pyrrhocoris TaxID=157538 RepID=A0A0M9G1Y1_LEPPY|nr:hypothetical protein ABB37_04745 [Leptomonas pyrrhocoris]XP_015658976.1 hypothetical protein ABB37_04745 [Leptomonas pyrrhocoris]KPA80536.1 hypothetical protein ABB37_04745 [Leptomonas pyrrhocoris]KPA80537.1 hypothetical protein ABB37_04745 [Leptomonas pyrrhocoris]|eukprot:XP_015658975.1 hypothetical protein ABB37_04745 [Leptomonas pyrrhocoris]
MAIGLGRTIGNPIFLFFQIVHGVSLFFIMLGVARVVLGVLELTTNAAAPSSSLPPPRPSALPPRQQALSIAHSPAAAFPLPTAERSRIFSLHQVASQQLPYTASLVADQLAPAAEELVPSFPAQLSYCFHVPLQSLFHSPVAIYLKANDEGGPPLLDAAKMPPLRSDGSAGRFYLQHFCAAVLCAYPLALLLQRRKFVLDFVVTIYAVYWVFTDLMLQAVLGGGTWHWWGACLTGLATMYAVTYVICRRKEMQEVKLSSGGAGAGANAATVLTSTTTTASAAAASRLKDGRGEINSSDAREMEEVRPVFQDAFCPSGGQPR